MITVSEMTGQRMFLITLESLRRLSMQEQQTSEATLRVAAAELNSLRQGAAVYIKPADAGVYIRTTKQAALTATQESLAHAASRR